MLIMELKNDVQNQKFKCYFFLAMLFIHLNCVSMSCKVLEILAVEICLPSFEYNGTKWLKNTFEKLHSDVAFQKSRRGYSR